MSQNKYEVYYYKTIHGVEPFKEWLRDIREKKDRKVVQRCLYRAEEGNLGSTRYIGNGVSEFKVDYGPGYRVYFAFGRNEKLIVLLGGTKRTQKHDILKSQFYREDYQRRTK